MSLSRGLAPRARRYVALAMVLAIAFAALAQASHFHQDELGSRADAHCLLCLYATGTAGPPALPSVVHAASVLHFFRDLTVVKEESSDTASYDARGPPQA